MPEAPLDDAAQSPIGAGDILAGKYRVERQIGRGGMGIVLAATHLQLEHQVAIKVLRRDLVEDDKALNRLFAEARAAAKIRSEHVARVLDVGTLDSSSPGGGAPFIVMEYLEGEDLADLLDRQGALDVTMAVQFMLQSCEALAEVHAAEMVHRDLKPGNLFVAKLPDGSPSLKIVDFGISKHIGASAHNHASTTTSTVLGSPYYMPPEQMRAEPVDERSDIWSLGAILFEMLTGRPPFLGDTLPEVYAAVLSGTVQSVCSLRPDIPQGLDDIVQRCLDKDPEQRFADVAELAEALRPYGGVNGAQSVERVARILNNAQLFRGRASATPRAGAVEARGGTPGGAAQRPLDAGPGTARGGISLEPLLLEPLPLEPLPLQPLPLQPLPLAPSPVLDIGPGSAAAEPGAVGAGAAGAVPASSTVVTPELVSPALAASFARRSSSNSPVELPLSSTAESSGPFTELASRRSRRGLRAAWGAVAFAAVLMGGALWMRFTGDPAKESPLAAIPLPALPSPAESPAAAARPSVVERPAAAPGAAAPRQGRSDEVRGGHGVVPPAASAAVSTPAVSTPAVPTPGLESSPAVAVEALRPAVPARHVEPERTPERKAKPAARAPARVTPRASAPRRAPRAVPPRSGSASTSGADAKQTPPKQSEANPAVSKQKGSASDPWNPSSFGDRH